MAIEILESLYLAMESAPDRFSDDQKEERIIRLVDLMRFEECIQVPVKMINCINYEICIAEVDGILKGLVFFDKNQAFRYM